MQLLVITNETAEGDVLHDKRAVYSQGVYAGRGQADMTNTSDGIYRQAGARALMSLRRKGSRVSSGYTGSLTVGVRT
jgi:hypothetical protein